MPKKTNLQEVRPLRVDPATVANCAALITSGLAADTSAALRAGVAITARFLSDDPHIYVVEPGREIFGTRAAAVAFIEAQGAQPVGDAWAIYDEDGDPEWYSVRPVLPR